MSESLITLLSGMTPTEHKEPVDPLEPSFDPNAHIDSVRHAIRDIDRKQLKSMATTSTIAVSNDTRRRKP